MDRKKACKILEIEETATQGEIKKKYRALMRKVHPDANVLNKDSDCYRQSAQELNAAYAYLCEHPIKPESRMANRKTSGKDNWRAKENNGAYKARKIFYELKGEDGEKLGEIIVAEGKYFWIEDESFPMFLKSMFVLSKEILDEIDAELGVDREASGRFAVQAELAYLLSAQFLDGEYSIKHLNQGLEAGEKPVYRFDAMVETNGSRIAGDKLSPGRISAHKLFLKDEKGIEVGYLSFADDRLYYVIIPLLEQRMVQVKIRLRSENTQRKSKRTVSRNYKDLDLWLRFKEPDGKQLPNSINLQIERLLSNYRNFCI